MYEVVYESIVDKNTWVDKINKHLKINSNDFTFQKS